MEGVQSFVDRAVQQLGASPGPAQNATPQDLQQGGYAMPARTREDVVQSNPGIVNSPADIAAPSNQQLVQQGLQEESNDMFALLSQAADPATQQLGQGVPNQPMPQPMQQSPVSSSGLILPPGAAPQPVQEAQHEGAGPGLDADQVSWLL